MLKRVFKDKRGEGYLDIAVLVLCHRALSGSRDLWTGWERDEPKSGCVNGTDGSVSQDCMVENRKDTAK